MRVGQILRQGQQRVAALQHAGRIKVLLHAFPGLLAVLLVGIFFIILSYQIPAEHAVDIGGYDAAYVQGFHDAESSDNTHAIPPYLAGSDGSVRWSRDRSFLLFPQAGLPGRVTLRLRGWRVDSVPPPCVEVLLNGQELLGSIQTSGAWEEHEFTITSGLLKATDIFLEVRTPTTTLPADERAVGVLLDRVTYAVPATSGRLIMPYPAQVIYGALAAGLLWMLLHGSKLHRQRIWFFVLSGLLSLCFLLFYRLQPPFYPYPLRWLLPGINIGLAAALLLRYGPALVTRFPALLDMLVPAGVMLWTGAILLVARQHLTLSIPGVENDFRVFATRTGSLNEIFRADGFYNLGYPLLLWLVQPLTGGNPFLAARLVGALSGALLLLAGAWLARTLLAQTTKFRARELHRAGGLLALLLLALNPFVVQYALYVGSDMPFAALTTLALALLLWSVTRQQQIAFVVLAGVAAGGAFLVRHLGMLLLPWGLLTSLLLTLRIHHREETDIHQANILTRYAAPIAFFVGFLLAALPQLVVNLVQTGQPLYNQQAKNVWLAVYGNIDWRRWDEVPNTITLSEIVLRDPGRFLGNWWGNLRGFVGTGAEDTSEFGRAVQLRLLGWPANWLALAGLLAWLWGLVRGNWRRGRNLSRLPIATPQGLLLLFGGGYVLAVSMAFILPRFFLPLAPIYAAAAAWIVCLGTGDERRTTDNGQRTTDDGQRMTDDGRTGMNSTFKTQHSKL